MREIKFKVWDKENKKFITSIQGKTHINIDLNGNVYNLQDGSGGKERYELIEFTGLKDKNGKDIYEGDICNTRHHTNNFYYIGIIEYSGPNGQWFIHQKFPYEFDLCFEEIKEIEIIGNIYENPELISHS